MDLPVFFTDSISTENFVTLSEETSKHIVQVLRMKTGEMLQLTDGAGNLLTASITDDHKKKCTVNITERQVTPPKDKQVCIAISLLKNASRFEWFLEKATEIGATEIIPLLCDHTEKQHFKYARMHQILVSAMLQSRQVWLPKLHQPVTATATITGSSYATKLIAHCADYATKQLVAHFKHDPSIQIFIGPEGDFSQAEIALALQHGFMQVTLGDNRLRTETAGVVAATLLCL